MLVARCACSMMGVKCLALCRCRPATCVLPAAGDPTGPPLRARARVSVCLFISAADVPRYTAVHWLVHRPLAENSTTCSTGEFCRSPPWVSSSSPAIVQSFRAGSPKLQNPSSHSSQPVNQNAASNWRNTRLQAELFLCTRTIYLPNTWARPLLGLHSRLGVIASKPPPTISTCIYSMCMFSTERDTTAGYQILGETTRPPRP